MIRTKGLSVMLLILELLLGLVEFLCLSGCGNDREEYEYIYYPEGTSWKEIVTDPFRPFFYQIYLYTVREDTIIKGDEYRKVYVNGKKNAVFYLHEQGKQIFYYDKSIPKPLLVYDFEWKIGKPVSAFLVDDRSFHIIDTIRQISREKLSLHQEYKYIDTPLGRYVNSIGFVDQSLFPYSMSKAREGFIIKTIYFERGENEIFSNHNYDYLWQ